MNIKSNVSRLSKLWLLLGCLSLLIFVAWAYPSESRMGITPNSLGETFETQADLSIYSGPNRTVCKGVDVPLEVAVSGGTGTYSYTWASDAAITNVLGTNDVHITNPLTNTTYYVRIDDGNESMVDSIIVNAIDCSRMSDSLALVQFYNDMGGPNWTNSWDLGQPMNTWYGVTLGQTDAKDLVESIDLRDNNLTGTLQDWNLPALEVLILSSNQISGQLPDFANMPFLRDFQIIETQLSGTIPDFSNLPFLRGLDLGFNQLTGTLPDWSGMPSLRFFSVYSNQLEGAIPDFGNIPHLEEVSLSLNQFTSFPDFFNIPKVWHLQLGDNPFGGNVPQFTNLPNLQILILYKNGFQGNIPDFTNHPKLRILELYGNELTGPIPDFSNLPALTNLAVHTNELTGSIPNFSGIPNLEVLELHNNQLNGPIPDFSNLPKLTTLNLGDNPLGSSIPNFSNLPQLRELSLINNQLVGALPDFSNIPLLEFLYLTVNQLSGPVPDFTNLPNLKVLQGAVNQFSGPVPDFSGIPNVTLLDLGTNPPMDGTLPNFSNLPNVQVLGVGGNQMTGSIPDFSNLPNVEILYLGVSNYSGPLPNFSNLPKLKELQVQKNQLSGAFPDFSNTPDLEIIFMANNQFTSVPDFSNTPELHTIYMADNQLSELPDLGQLTKLEILGADYNFFSFDDVIPNLGAIPTYYYAPQFKLPFSCDTIQMALSSDLSIDMNIDKGLNESTYQWYKDDVPYLLVKGKSILTLYDLEAGDAGAYRCEVTNPNAPALTLHSDTIVIQVGGGENFQLIASDVFGAAGDTVCVNVLSQAFNNISASSYSMEWDTSVLRFISVRNLNLPDLQADDFDFFYVQDGRLGIDWTSANGSGVSVQDSATIFQLCFEVKTVDCLNSTIDFGNRPVAQNIIGNGDKCIFFDGQAGTFISTCELPVEIPDFADYEAELEYTDTTGVTSYITESLNKNLTGDTLILSIAKRGQDIGRIGDGVFSVEVAKDTGTIDLTDLIRLQSPGQFSQAIALNYFWNVNPNYSSTKLDTTLGLEVYFTQEDVDVLSAATGLELEPQDLFFFKVSGSFEGNPCDKLFSRENEGEEVKLDVYTHESKPGVNKWVFSGFPGTTTSYIGGMDLDGFSCGGIMALLQFTAVKEIPGLTYFSLSPNPTRDHLNLSLQANDSKDLQLRIVNSQGAIILQKPWMISNGRNNLEIDLPNQVPGLYFLQLQDEQGAVESHKFILME